MWFLEILESALLAVPWIIAAFIVVIAVGFILAITSWLALFVWVDVLGRDVSWDLEPAGGWDPDDVERSEEVADGRPA